MSVPEAAAVAGDRSREGGYATWARRYLGLTARHHSLNLANNIFASSKLSPKNSESKMLQIVALSLLLATSLLYLVLELPRVRISDGDYFDIHMRALIR
jgi:hypothetical protein